MLTIETIHNFKHNKMIFTDKDKLYVNTNICHICNKECKTKVRDHCHKTGNDRGPVCGICNLTHKQQNIPQVVFHNCSGYELDLLFNEVFKQNNDYVMSYLVAMAKPKCFVLIVYIS